MYERWAEKYGPAYVVPGGFGSKRVVICDPRANAHFYARETFGYVQTKLSRVFIENLFGRGLLWAEGESHKRQRKALTPAFSNAAVRKLTSVFFDSAYKMKAIWDAKMDASTTDDIILDVQIWMNHISLDSIGIAGFSHNFGALDGNNTPVVDVFDSFASSDTSFLSKLVFFLGPVFPMLQKLPTKQNRMFKRLRRTMGDIADELMSRDRSMREEAEGGGTGARKEEKSIIGLLLKAEDKSSSLAMTQEEILAQMNVLLLAGYETTSISLTWALIELCRRPDKQQRLRDELSQFSASTDPTWEQLSTGLPYLDAIVQEVLRLHPPVEETTRVAAQDDIIPFSTPFGTSNNNTSLVIAKGTVITSPIRALNRSEALWGPNAKEFVPERWLNDMSGVVGSKAKEIVGHRHILTFSDGPRTCLGKGFALANFKATLSVLIRNYVFAFPDGVDTKIEKHPSILPRPKVAGEVGARVPLRVRRIE